MSIEIPPSPVESALSPILLDSLSLVRQTDYLQVDPHNGTVLSTVIPKEGLCQEFPLDLNRTVTSSVQPSHRLILKETLPPAATRT